MRSIRSVVLVLALIASSHASGQEAKTLPGDEIINAYLKNRTQEIGKSFMAGARTKGEWLKVRPKLKEQYLDMLGLWPLPGKTPLNAKVTGTVEIGGLVIENLHFQSKPGLYVTGNLYRPKKVDGKLPTVLYVCGHSGKGRDGNKTAFQDHGMWFASNGYICLIIDTLQLGEIAGKHHGTYNLNRFWWQSLGYTPAGVECWNGVRAIDYLVTRADVDAERIGVTGISGGGASTIWIAAADDRVKVAVPVSGISDLESYVSNKVINGHCDCMFLVNTYQWDWTTAAALIAPRPILFANSDNDRIFPMDGNRRIIAKLRDCYKMLGAPELVDEHVSVGGHDYRPDLRVAIFKFFNKHLKKDNGEVKDADFKPLPGKELRAFPEDGDLPKDAINGKIDETFVNAKRPKLPEAKGFEEWKKELLDQLRRTSFRSFPATIPMGRLKKKDDAGEFSDFQLETEFGIDDVSGASPNKAAKAEELRLLAINPRTKADFDSYKPHQTKEPFQLLYSRGENVTAWTIKSPPNYVERSHALVGRTTDDGRLWDVVAAIRYLNAKQEQRWRVIGRGQQGIIAAYAALFEPSIQEVIVVDPPISHRDGPHFLNVLRVLDIPDALGLLAPRPLTIVGGKDKAFDRTAEIYRLAGAADKLKRE